MMGLQSMARNIANDIQRLPLIRVVWAYLFRQAWAPSRVISPKSLPLSGYLSTDSRPHLQTQRFGSAAIPAPLHALPSTVRCSCIEIPGEVTR
jgi:hypothetical protein